MSKADKMFEKLGYKKIESENIIIYVNTHGKNIEFSKLINRFAVYGKYYFLDMQELQAINEKVKELRVE